MAPELLTSRGKPSKASDVWSLGITLLELFNGQLNNSIYELALSYSVYVIIAKRRCNSLTLQTFCLGKFIPNVGRMEKIMHC